MSLKWNHSQEVWAIIYRREKKAVVQTEMEDSWIDSSWLLQEIFKIKQYTVILQVEFML